MLYNHLFLYHFSLFKQDYGLYLLAGEAERFSAEYKRDNGGLIYLK